MSEDNYCILQTNKDGSIHIKEFDQLVTISIKDLKQTREDFKSIAENYIFGQGYKIFKLTPVLKGKK